LDVLLKEILYLHWKEYYCKKPPR